MSEQKNTPPLFPLNGLSWPSTDAEFVEQMEMIMKRYAPTNLTGKELEALLETYSINQGRDIKARRQPADCKKIIRDMVRPLPPMGG